MCLLYSDNEDPEVIRAKHFIAKKFLVSFVLYTDSPECIDYRASIPTIVFIT
jgi:hypothetical protein